MPSYYMHHYSATKPNNNRDMIITSGISKGNDFNTKRKDLFSPTNSLSKDFRSERKTNNSKDTDFFNNRALSRFQTTKHNNEEYIDKGPEIQTRISTIKPDRNDRNSSISCSKYRANSYINKSQKNSMTKNPIFFDTFNMSQQNKRERELLAEIHNLNSSLQQYKELNNNLAERLKYFENNKQHKYTFTTDMDNTNRQGNINIEEYKNKLEYAEKSNERLRSDVYKLRQELKELKENTNSKTPPKRSESKDMMIKGLAAKVERQKKKIYQLKQTLKQEEGFRMSLGHENYRELFKQESEKNKVLLRENEKLRTLNENYNKDYTKIVEELNALKIKELYEDNGFSTLKADYEAEIRQNAMLKEQLAHYKKVLKIYGYDAEGVTLIPQNEMRFSTPKKIHKNESEVNAKTTHVNKQGDRHAHLQQFNSEKNKNEDTIKMDFSKSRKQLDIPKEIPKLLDLPNDKTPKKDFNYGLLQDDTINFRLTGLNSMSDRQIEENNIPQRLESNHYNSIISDITESKQYSIEQNPPLENKDIWKHESYSGFRKPNTNNNNDSVVNKTNLNEYTENDSQVKNIFNMTLNHNNLDLTHSHEDRNKMSEVHQFRYENIGPDIDSFGTAGRKFTNGSIQSKIKRI